jgi:hypothetical protein
MRWSWAHWLISELLAREVRTAVCRKTALRQRDAPSATCPEGGRGCCVTFALAKQNLVAPLQPACMTCKV